MRNWVFRSLKWLLRRLRPDEGWAVLLSLAVIVLALAGAVQDAHWLGEEFRGYGAAMLGLWMGFWLARYVQRGWVVAGVAWGIGILFGVLAAAMQFHLPSDWRGFVTQLQHFRFSIISSIAAWGDVGVVPLPLALLDAIGFFLLFVAAVWASWFAFHRHDAWRAMLLPGVLLTWTVFFSHSGYFWEGAFIFAFIILAIGLNLAQQRRDWEAHQIDYSPEIGLDIFLNGLLIALGVSLFALMTPNLAVTPVTNAFWRIWAEPYALLESQISPLFGELERPPRSLIGGGSARPGGLPRAHLLGGRPELTEQVIMTVSVDDPDPGAPEFWSDYRWRGPTYATYTGRGWDNPPIEEIQRLGPGDTWLKTIPADRRPLRQEFRFLAGRPYWLYAEGEPVATDIRSRAFLLGRDNLIGMTANVRRYTVVSQAPIFNVDNLRHAPTDYAPDLDIYLQLPEDTPQRVFDLAQQITADENNPYDQAMALQAFLRTYPYTLDVPLPPKGVDVADYFLFDLKKGYCDYYATAMVVMARSLGIPARLAVGYAPGSYDPKKNRLVVREKDAHSWPELYFPGYGWIPFEPTAARPTFVPQPQLRRTQEANQLDVDRVMRSLRWQGLWQQVKRWGSWLLLIAVGLWGGRWVWREWRLRRQADNPWQLAWLRLERASMRLGVAPAPWLTPNELAQALVASLRHEYPQHPATPDLASAIQFLAQQVEARAYAPPAQRPDDREAPRAWRRIRIGLLRLRLQKAK